MPVWSTDVPIRFSHCDPARIVYFASHFDILNGVVEDWFTQALDLPYHRLIVERRLGLGYAHAACDFHLPARFGDVLRYTVYVERVGNKSLPLRIEASRDGEKILTASLVIVSTNLDKAGEGGGAIPLPDDICAAVTAYREESA